MEKINRYMMTGSLWVIFIAGWFMTGAFTGSLFYFLDNVNASAFALNFEKCVKLGAMVGVPFGAMIVLMVSMIRKSHVFWEYAEVVEKLIEEADTKEKVTFVFNNEFQSLRQKCQGGPQITELQRLYTIMQTKIKYVQ